MCCLFSLHSGISVPKIVVAIANSIMDKVRVQGNSIEKGSSRNKLNWLEIT